MISQVSKVISYYDIMYDITINRLWYHMWYHICMISQSDYDITCDIIYDITLWYHVWYHNYLTMISCVTSHMYDVHNVVKVSMKMLPEMHVEPMRFAKIERKSTIPVAFWKQERCAFTMITWGGLAEETGVLAKERSSELWRAFHFCTL